MGKNQKGETRATKGQKVESQKGKQEWGRPKLEKAKVGEKEPEWGRTRVVKS